MIYLFDTNIVSKLIVEPDPIYHAMEERPDGIFCICDPVDYEIRRGLRWRDAHQKLARYETRFLPVLYRVELLAEDWKMAARFWAELRSEGRQLSDMDFLLAALAHRLDAIIVSNDNDFDALPIPRENWYQ